MTDEETASSDRGDPPILLTALNRQDLDTAMSFFAEDCVFETPRGRRPWGRRLHGIENVRRALERAVRSHPDARYVDDEHWVCGSQGPRSGPSSGRSPMARRSSSEDATCGSSEATRSSDEAPSGSLRGSMPGLPAPPSPRVPSTRSRAPSGARRSPLPFGRVRGLVDGRLRCRLDFASARELRVVQVAIGGSSSPASSPCSAKSVDAICPNVAPSGTEPSPDPRAIGEEEPVHRMVPGPMAAAVQTIEQLEGRPSAPERTPRGSVRREEDDEPGARSMNGPSDLLLPVDVERRSPGRGCGIDANPDPSSRISPSSWRAPFASLM